MTSVPDTRVVTVAMAVIGNPGWHPTPHEVNERARVGEQGGKYLSV